MAEADDHYWASMISEMDETGVPTHTESSPLQARYQAARKRALARGFVYGPAPELAREATTVELMQRLEHVAATKTCDENCSRHTKKQISRAEEQLQKTQTTRRCQLHRPIWKP